MPRNLKNVPDELSKHTPKAADPELPAATDPPVQERAPGAAPRPPASARKPRSKVKPKAPDDASAHLPENLRARGWRLQASGPDVDGHVAVHAHHPFAGKQGHLNGTLRDGRLKLFDTEVQPPYRGKGIGRALFSALYQHAAQRGATAVDVPEHSTDASRLLGRLHPDYAPAPSTDAGPRVGAYDFRYAPTTVTLKSEALEKAAPPTGEDRPGEMLKEVMLTDKNGVIHRGHRWVKLDLPEEEPEGRAPKTEAPKEPPAPPRARVALVMAYDAAGRLLLGRRNDSGKWVMPGGHLDEGEAPADGARRELKEETGLDSYSLSILPGITPNPPGIGPELHVFTALVAGQAHGHLDPDREVSRWTYVPLKDGCLPPEVYDHLHGPAGELNVVRQVFDRAEAETVEKAELEKGAMQRLHPYNPAQRPEGETKIHDWMDSSISRGNVPEMPAGSPERERALHRLAAKTTVRRAADGKREFLLHRGMGLREGQRATREPGVFASVAPPKRSQAAGMEENVAHPGLSSWTPDYGIAAHFQRLYTPKLTGRYAKWAAASDYEKKYWPNWRHQDVAREQERLQAKAPVIHSVWVHEDQIHNIPRQYGRTTWRIPGQPWTPGPQRLGWEHETLVKPGRFKQALPEEVAQARASGTPQSSLDALQERYRVRSERDKEREDYEKQRLDAEATEKIDPERADAVQRWFHGQHPGYKKAEPAAGAQPWKRPTARACPHGLRVVLVDGEHVRDHFDSDFVQGGNPERYSWVPKGEIWIDQTTPEAERPFVLEHECREAGHMAEGWSYDRAHQAAKDQEGRERHAAPGEMIKGELLEHHDPGERELHVRTQPLTRRELIRACLDHHPEVRAAALRRPDVDESVLHSLVAARRMTDGQHPGLAVVDFISHPKAGPEHARLALQAAEAHGASAAHVAQLAHEALARHAVKP